MIDAANIVWLAGAAVLALSFLVCRRPEHRVNHHDSEETPRSLKSVVRSAGKELPAFGLIILLFYGLFNFVADSPWIGISFIMGAGATALFTGVLLSVLPGGLHCGPVGDGPQALMRIGAKAGLFTAGAGLLSLAAFNSYMPAAAPESWILFGFGASLVSFIRVCLNLRRRSPVDASNSEEQEGASSERIAERLFEIYALIILPFSILMAASLFMKDLLPGRSEIALLLASAGSAASVVGIGFRFLLRGRGAGPAAVVTGAVYCGAAYLILKGVANGITSQVLADLRILDRMSPFWAAAAGIISVLSAHFLYCRYKKTEGVNEKNRYLLGRAERIYLPLLFPLTGVWIAYESAGVYGIVLSAAAAAGILPFLGFPALSGAARDRQVRSPFSAGLREPCGWISFFTAAGCLALIPLYAAELGKAADSGSLELAGTFLGIGLGIAHPFLIRKLTGGSYWKSAVLPIFVVVSFIVLIGAVSGVPALLGFLAATLCTEAACLVVDLYKQHREPPCEGSALDLILAKTTTSAAPALLPLIFIIYKAIH